MVPGLRVLPMPTLPSIPPPQPKPKVSRPRLPKFDRRPAPAAAKPMRHKLDKLAVVPSPVTDGTKYSDHDERAKRIKNWSPDLTDQKAALKRLAAETAYRALTNLWSKLSPQQREAIQEYTGGSYSSMNKLARGKNVQSVYYPDQYNQYIDDIEDAFQMLQTRLPVDTKAYRYTNYSSGFPPDIDQAKPGSTVTDWGIGSFTIQRGATSGFSHGDYRVYYEILAPKGTKGVYVDPRSQNKGEEEVIFPRGSTLLVHEVVREQHQWGGGTTIRIVGEVLK